MRVLALLGIIAGACVHARHPAFPDAPLQLRDDSDRDQAIDRLRALPPGAERDAVRADVAAAIARRLTDALDDERPLAAERLLFQLAALWQDDPQAIAAAGNAPLIERVRATFAKSGAIEPTICALVMLAELEPARRAARLAELDEVLGFADEMAAVENGAVAVRAQPIAQLQPTVLALPLRWLVDRYVKLVEDRHAAVAAAYAQSGPTMELVRAHRDVAQSSRRIAIALARGGRTAEIHAHLAVLGTGLFADRELAIRAQIVAEQPTAEAYLELARALRADTATQPGDPRAALAVELAAIAKLPHDNALYAAAATDAAALGRIDQPIALYRQALGAEPGDVDQLSALRLGKLYAERIARLAYGGRPDAAATAWRELARFADDASHRRPDAVWAQVAAIAEAALGRGLVSQGRLADAERALAASLQRAPSIDAYESLATIYYKTDRFADADRVARAGLALVGDTTTGDRYRRAKLDRLDGDILRRSGRARDAQVRYLDAFDKWASLGTDRTLSRAIAAERHLELGRAAWALGNLDQAVAFALDAVDADPGAAPIDVGAIAFLLEIDRYADAVDVLHHMLDTPDVGELYKTYACLWVSGDAHRRGAARDRTAHEYLASRRGDLWYEQLAEAATGRLELAALRASATTAPRKAELAFYGAVLGLDPHARLEDVVRAGLVTDAEYDLARHYLAAP